MRDTAIWINESGEEREAAIERKGANGDGFSYQWRTLRKLNWCQVCDLELQPGIEALAYDFDQRWCIPCAVDTFEFAYWDTPADRARRDEAHDELLRRVAEVLD